ncbi:hypothetical protein MMC25_003985 [Agyrium rufum]|nr:hypothetical protein [Agyrium rufum]
MDLSAAVEGRLSDESERETRANTTNGVKATHGANHEESPMAQNEQGFQQAIAAWRKIDLSKLVPELDKTVSDVLSNQRESLVQRKELAQKTKEFRKLDDASKLTEYKTLLKSYQTFIDLLTSHGKTTSSAFLQLFSTVSEAPDPYPLLEASVDSILLSEETLPKITAENERLQDSVVSLTDDLEATEARLAQEQSARKKLEETLETRSKDIEDSWQAVLTEKKDNWEAKEKNLEGKLENQERLLNEIKASYEVAQRLGRGPDGSAENQQISASAAELEIISSELERTNQRLAEVEGRNEQLRIELAHTSSAKQQDNSGIEDPNTSRLRSENSSLLRKLDAMRIEKDSDARKREERLRSLEKETQKLHDDRSELRERLQKWRDYPELKRELEVFKAVEFSTGDDDEPSCESSMQGIPSNANGEVATSKKDSLEQLLLARNKKMSNEMATLRVSHQELQSTLDKLQLSLTTTTRDLEDSRNLNATLENDLLTLQREAANTMPLSARSTTSRYPSNSHFNRMRRSSPTSSIISGFDPQSHSMDTMEAIRAGEPVGGGSGILPMVQAQRDRFKQKNSELENDLAKQHNIVSSLRQEVASLQKDNLSLYEKTRYVSTYNRGQPASSGTAYSQHPQSTSVQMSSESPSGLSTDRYRSAYENNISPFAQFRGREATRAYKRMSLPERIVFSITRIVLANRMSRNLFAAYCVALHMLLFFMLYWMQSVDISRHASNLGEAAAAAGGAAAVVAGDTLRGAEAHHGEWHAEGLQDGRPG